MPTEAKKQFSLSLMMRIFLAVIVVISLAVFINSVMKYNELLNEQAELEQTKAELTEEKEELEELSESRGSQSYIEKLARKFWNLFYPDEEIFVGDRNG